MRHYVSKNLGRGKKCSAWRWICLYGCLSRLLCPSFCLHSNFSIRFIHLTALDRLVSVCGFLWVFLHKWRCWLRWLIGFFFCTCQYSECVHIFLCRAYVGVFRRVTHWVAAGAGRGNDSKVCRSGIGCGLVSWALERRILRRTDGLHGQSWVLGTTVSEREKKREEK